MEAASARGIRGAHTRRLAGVRSEIDPLVRSLLERAAERGEVTQRWLSNQPRWLAFQRLLHESNVAFDREALHAIRDAQRQAISLANEHSKLLIAARLGTADTGLVAAFNRVPIEATMEMVGHLQGDSPLRSLRNMSETQTRLMGRTLIDGVAHGRHATVIARSMRDATGIKLPRALTISRTEVMRSYRSATRASWQQNSMVRAWRWSCKLSGGSCAACWAMHGSIHDTDTPMGTHPNCQCIMIPVLAPLSELGIDVDMPDEPDALADQPGEDIFATKDENFQREVLGPTRYELYKEGVPLKSMVDTRQTADWGVTRTTASVTQIRERAI
jgi:SPP1 gp7 family putative phage head morphogenesis protein